MRGALLLCLVMPRVTPGAVLPPSIRATAEVRRLEAAVSEAQRLAEVANEEKTNAWRHRNSEKKELKEVKLELKDALPATLAGKSGSVNRLKPQSSAFYEQVDFGVNWLRRFHILDVPMILVACMKSLGRESDTNVCREVMMDKGMGTTRKQLLHEHEKQMHRRALAGEGLHGRPLLAVAADHRHVKAGLRPDQPVPQVHTQQRRHQDEAGDVSWLSGARARCVLARCHPRV